MTPLKRAALASLALDEARVEAIYNATVSKRLFSDSVVDQLVARLCVSHERLRTELMGAEIMLADYFREEKP